MILGESRGGGGGGVSKNWVSSFPCYCYRCTEKLLIYLIHSIQGLYNICKSLVRVYITSCTLKYY